MMVSETTTRHRTDHTISGVADWVPEDWSAELATEIVDEIRQQNWSRGGVLMLDRPDAILLVAARLELVRAQGACDGIEGARQRLAADALNRPEGSSS